MWKTKHIRSSDWKTLCLRKTCMAKRKFDKAKANYKFLVLTYNVTKTHQVKHLRSYCPTGVTISLFISSTCFFKVYITAMNLKFIEPYNMLKVLCKVNCFLWMIFLYRSLFAKSCPYGSQGSLLLRYLVVWLPPTPFKG